MIAQSVDINNGLLANLDILEPLWDKKLYQTYADQGLDLLRMIYDVGGKQATRQISGEFWQEDRFDTAFTISGNVAAPGAGANATVTLSSAYVDSTTRGSYPIVGNLVIHEPSEARYQIITKSDNGTNTTLVLRPLMTTTNEAFTAGDTFIIYSNSVKEQSDAQATQASFLTKKNWYLQDIRNDDEISGTALSDSLKVSYREDGKTIQGWSSIMTLQLEYRHLKSIVGQLIYGKKDDNLASTTSLQTSEGMLDYFRSNAQVEDTGGTLTVGDFENLEAKLTKQWSKSNFVTWLSGKSFGEISADVRTDFNNSLMNAVDKALARAMFGDGPQADALYATYAVQGLDINGRAFGLKRLMTFDDVAWAGAVDNSALQDYGVVIPLGKTAVKDKDGKESLMNYVTMFYKDYNQNRLMRMWQTGGASPARNTSVDESKVHVISEVGFAFPNANQCGLFVKTLS